MESNSNVDYKWGIIFIVSSAFCFALMNLFIRLAGDVPTMQKCFFRNFFRSSCCNCNIAPDKNTISYWQGKSEIFDYPITFRWTWYGL